MLQPIEDGVAISMADAQAQLTEDDFRRIETGLLGFDWVVGGGLPLPIAVLLSAPEGAGKSTLLLELFRSLAKRKVKTLYVNTEETVKQLAYRYKRLGAFPEKYLKILHESRHERIMEMLEEEAPLVAAIDSVQNVEDVADDNGVPYAMGCVPSVTKAGRDYKRFSERQGMTIFVVGHVTNDRTIASGNTLKHILDGTIYLEGGDDEKDIGRLLYCKRKNRFAPRGRRARFEMREQGMIDCGPLLDGPPLDDKEAPDVEDRPENA